MDSKPNVFEGVKKKDLTLARIQAELARRFGPDVVAFRKTDRTVELGRCGQKGGGMVFDPAGTVVRLGDTLQAIRKSEGPIPDDMLLDALAAFARGKTF